MSSPEPPGVELVVEADAARAGAAARAHLDAGERVAGFVGEADDPAIAEFVADVLRPPAPEGGDGRSEGVSRRGDRRA